MAIEAWISKISNRSPLIHHQVHLQPSPRTAPQRLAGWYAKLQYLAGQDLPPILRFRCLYHEVPSGPSRSAYRYSVQNRQYLNKL